MIINVILPFACFWREKIKDKEILISAVLLICVIIIKLKKVERLCDCLDPDRIVLIYIERDERDFVPILYQASSQISTIIPLALTNF